MERDHIATKEQMIAEASFIDVAAINVEALDRVDTLLNDI